MASSNREDQTLVHSTSGNSSASASATPARQFTFSMLRRRGMIVRSNINSLLYVSGTHNASDVLDLYISPTSGTVYTVKHDAVEAFVLVPNIRADRLDALLQLPPNVRLAEPDIVSALTAAGLSTTIKSHSVNLAVKDAASAQH